MFWIFDVFAHLSNSVYQIGIDVYNRDFLPNSYNTLLLDILQQMLL